MNANPPFDSAALADVVLRSSDNVYFYVFGAFLQYASPVFRHLFSLRSTSPTEAEKRGGHPVIPITEDSETVHYLLNVLYPFGDEPKQDYSLAFMKAVAAAEKYDMAGALKRFKSRVHGQNWLEEEPLRMFAISVAFGWNQEATTAARTVGTLWFSGSQLECCEELEKISGMDLYRLLEFRFRCENLGDVNSEQEQLVFEEMSRGTTPLLGAAKEPEDAEEPFHLSAKADIILRSSDRIDFHVLKCLLELVSPVISDMFTNTTTKSLKDGLQVIHLADESNALHQFLLMIYHRIDVPPTNDLGLYGAVCTMAQKYRVQIIEERLKKGLMTSGEMVEQPLRVYAMATTFGWIEAAKAAAGSYNRWQPLNRTIIKIPELRWISGADLFRFVNPRIKFFQRGDARQKR